MKRMLSPLTLLALSLALLSCGPAPSSSSSISSESSPSSSSESLSSESFSSSESSSGESSVSSEPIASDSESLELSSGSSEESSESSAESSGHQVSEDTTITVYATNDIHGQVYPENPYSSSGRMGVATMMTYLKDARDEDPNAFLIDQGDTWQGSIYSNVNHGALITDIMNYVRYDARTVGNHDFDWGLEPLIENGKRSYEGYSVPVLSANVYDYDFANHKEGDRLMDEIGVKSVVRELDSGCRVGIVGVIGYNQITSISTIYAKDVCFKSHVQIAKDEAKRLREEEDCDVLILSIHAGQADVIGAGFDKYFDLTLCGHTHRRESTKDGAMPIIQTGAYTQAIGKIELQYKVSEGKVTSYKMSTLNSSTVTDAVSEINPKIQNMIDGYGEACNELANTVIVDTVEGYFDKAATLPNLMCEAMYDRAIEEGFHVDLAYCNEARHYIGNDSRKTTLYYADVFEAFPFDNQIYIIEITADEMRREIMDYNSIYRDPNKEVKIQDGLTYTIACIDFLAFHTNTNRQLDFFPSVGNADFDEYPTLSDNYREILCDYLVGQGYAEEGAQSLKASNYYSSNAPFDKGLLL